MTVDMMGTAAVIGAVFAGVAAVVGPIVTAYLQIKASRKIDTNKQESVRRSASLESKVDSVAAVVNGHSTEQTRKIDALTGEVQRLNVPGAASTLETAVGTPEGAGRVTIDKGVVTSEAPVASTSEGP